MPDRIEMHEVRTWDELLNPGDYLFCQRSEDDPTRATHGIEFPIIVCPKCRKAGSCSAHTLVQKSPLTIRASFLCQQQMPDGSGVCGWHGFITDGWMEGA